MSSTAGYGICRRALVSVRTIHSVWGRSDRRNGIAPCRGRKRRGRLPHLGLGIAATLAANVTRGLGHGLIGAAVAAWPAVAVVGSYELLMLVIGTRR